jgi:drug/metabolite transporter (DMT)-like permease
MPSASRLGFALVLTASTAFGAVPIAGRSAYDHGAGTLTFLAGRYVLAALALGVLLVLVPRTRPSGALPLRPLGAAAAATILANLGYLGAVARDDVTRVAPLVFLFPVLVPLVAAATSRERLQHATIVAAAVGVTGSLLAVGGGFALPRDGLAALLALLAAAANTAFILFVASALRDVRWAPIGAGLFAISALVLAPAAIVTGSDVPSARGWLFVAVAGVLCTAAPYGLWLRGLALVGESRTAALAVWEPAVAVLLALVLLGESVEPLQALGIVLVLGSLVVVGAGATRAARRRRRERARAPARH